MTLVRMDLETVVGDGLLQSADNVAEGLNSYGGDSHDMDHASGLGDGKSSQINKCERMMDEMEQGDVVDSVNNSVTSEANWRKDFNSADGDPRDFETG